jgi:hypothetical protein
MNKDELGLGQIQDQILTSDVTDDALEIIADGPAMSYTFISFDPIDLNAANTRPASNQAD